VGNVSILNTGDWVKPLVEEMRDFPAGRFDDQIDACSKAFSTLGGSGLNVAMWEKLGEGASFQPGTLGYQLQLAEGRLPAQPAQPASAQKAAATPYVPTGQLNRFGTM
jgi:hypothetical protein